MNAPLARLYLATRYHDLPPESRLADAATDLDAFEDQVESEPEADDESGWRWTLAVIAAGCAVVFVVVPLVRWW